MNCCGLHDLGFVGYPFTSRRGNGNHYGIEDMLDTTFATSDWYFPFSKVTHLPFVPLDHAPILVSIKGPN